MCVQFLGQKIPGVGNGKLLQWSCLENPVDRATLVGYRPRGHKGIAKSWIHLSNWAHTNTQNVKNSNSILFIPSLTAICCLCKIKI